MGVNHTAKHPSDSFGVGVLEIIMPQFFNQKASLHFARILGGHAGVLWPFCDGRGQGKAPIRENAMWG